MLTFCFTDVGMGDRGDPESWQRMRIENAEPREFMAAGLMRQLLHATPWAKREGDVLTLRDDYGHHYTYRVGDYDYRYDGYELVALQVATTQ